MESWLELYNFLLSAFGNMINDYWELFTGDYVWIFFPFLVSVALSIVTLILHYFSRGLSDV